MTDDPTREKLELADQLETADWGNITEKTRRLLLRVCDALRATVQAEQRLHDSSTGENYTRNAAGECYETPANQAQNKRAVPADAVREALQACWNELKKASEKYAGDGTWVLALAMIARRIQRLNETALAARRAALRASVPADAGMGDITDAMIEAGARIVAKRCGHKDFDALIVTTGGAQSPVWKFYIDEVKAILAAVLAARPLPPSNAVREALAELTGFVAGLRQSEIDPEIRDELLKLLRTAKEACALVALPPAQEPEPMNISEPIRAALARHAAGEPFEVDSEDVEKLLADYDRRAMPPAQEKVQGFDISEQSERTK